MKTDIAERWVDELNSGKYEQGELALCKDGKYCCLGVLCDMYAKEHGIEWVEGAHSMKAILGQCDVLPKEVMEWAGVKEDSGKVSSGLYLAELNDEGTPFRAIALIIEANKEVL